MRELYFGRHLGSEIGRAIYDWRESLTDNNYIFIYIISLENALTTSIGSNSSENILEFIILGKFFDFKNELILKSKHKSGKKMFLKYGKLRLNKNTCIGEWVGNLQFL